MSKVRDGKKARGSFKMFKEEKNNFFDKICVFD